jgi:uncharacterized protein DUF1801
MTKPPDALLDLLYRYDPPVRSLGLGLRELVLMELVPSHEYVFSMRSKLVLIYGSSQRVLADGVCSIAMFRQHVTLVFHHGVDLDDTFGMLRGSGKALRHIRVERPEDLARPELKSYLRQARKRSDLSRIHRSRATTVVTRFKSSSTAKREQFPRLF